MLLQSEDRKFRKKARKETVSQDWVSLETASAGFWDLVHRKCFTEGKDEAFGVGGKFQLMGCFLHEEKGFVSGWCDSEESIVTWKDSL